MIAIETRWKGYRFRSRREARWSIFFDRLGLAWEYEPEGYSLSDGLLYLPDFDVQELGWFEVKPKSLTKAEEWKLRLLAQGAQRDAYALIGTIPSPDDPGLIAGPRDEELRIERFFPDGGWDSGYWFCICGICGKVGIEFEARSARICKHPAWGWDDKGYNGAATRILMALEAARGARFEHKERALELP